MVGEVWRQDCEAAAHIIAIVSKLKTTHAYAQLIFSFRSSMAAQRMWASVSYSRSFEGHLHNNELPFFPFKFYFYFYFICKSVHHVHAVPFGSQRKVLDPLRL